MRLPADDPRNEQVIDVVNALADLFRDREEAEEVAMSAMMIMVGTILGNVCRTEDSLLRALLLCTDGLRSSATDTFTERQRERRARRRQ